jgi:hypothetical protein
LAQACVVPGIDVDGAEDGFHGVSQDGRALRTAATGFAFRQAQVLGQLQRHGDAVQHVLPHQVRAHAGEVALWRVGELAEQQVGHREVEHRVAQEFQAFVVVRAEAAVR